MRRSNLIFAVAIGSFLAGMAGAHPHWWSWLLIVFAGAFASAVGVVSET